MVIKLRLEDLFTKAVVCSTLSLDGNKINLIDFMGVLKIQSGGEKKVRSFGTNRNS